MRPNQLRMELIALCLTASMFGCWESYAATAEAVDKTALRVCADPANLPFSNKAGEGYENKIAEMLAQELGLPPQYTWYPQSVGFIRNTLRLRRCDLVIGIATGNELVQNTNPYYRSTYVMVYRSDAGHDIKSIADPAMKGLTIGVVAGTPPATLIARHGLMGHVRPYQLIVDTRFESPGAKMIDEIASGEIDVGVLWGPIAGYHARKHNPGLVIVPVVGDGRPPKMDYRISMGMRFNEPDWKHKINDLLKQKQAEIQAILLEFGIPILDENGQLIQQ